LIVNSFDSKMVFIVVCFCGYLIGQKYNSFSI
jgi:hypothetical protein